MSTEYSSESTAEASRVSWLAYPLIWAIYLYRITLAPILAIFSGSGCRFYPTCSHYGEQALRKYGALKGSIMAVKRVFRCHPWHEGGYDPVE